MASVGGVIGCGGSSSPWSSWIEMNNNNNNKDVKKKKRNQMRINCVSTVSDPYKTLKIHPGASESDVKKAFRKLALQYHPDVCRGSNCGVMFHQINEAYDAVMSALREEPAVQEVYNNYGPSDDVMRGMNDPDWDMWEEWMGWEGAGIRDYSSHINPYI